MKLAVSLKGNDLKGMLDKRFGRAIGFLIYETSTKEYEVIDNQQNLNAAQGAGIQAAQNVINAGAEVVITGHCGPKAFKMLKEADIKIYNSEVNCVESVIEEFEKGKLKVAESSDVDGHWI